MLMAGTSLRLVPARLLLVLGSTVLVLVCGEIGARLAWRGPPSFSRPEPVAADLPVFKTISEISRPNLNGVYQGRHFRTNSRGLRGSEVPLRPGPRVFRILVGGDSVTMGSGVDEEDAYPARLEAMLNADSDRREAAPRFEVLNAGLAGNDIGHTVGRLGWLSRVYDPHLVVYGFTVNDIEGVGYEALPGDPDHREAWRRSARLARSPSYLVRLIGPRWLSLRRALWPPLGSPLRELRHNFFENPRAWARFTGQLDRLVELARLRRICGHVFIHTRLDELGPFHPYRDIYQKVAMAAEGRGLGVTHSWPYFRGRSARELWVAPADSHPNAAGHAILAQALLDGLGDMPADCNGVASE